MFTIDSYQSFEEIARKSMGTILQLSVMVPGKSDIKTEDEMRKRYRENAHKNQLLFEQSLPAEIKVDPDYARTMIAMYMHRPNVMHKHSDLVKDRGMFQDKFKARDKYQAAVSAEAQNYEAKYVDKLFKDGVGPELVPGIGPCKEKDKKLIADMMGPATIPILSCYQLTKFGENEFRLIRGRWTVDQDKVSPDFNAPRQHNYMLGDYRYGFHLVVYPTGLDYNMMSQTNKELLNRYDDPRTSPVGARRYRVT